MADVSKAQKLASARKKFKELKKEKKKNSTQKNYENADSSPASREHTPIETVITQNTTEEVPLPNYFASVDYNGHPQPSSAFFDNFTKNENCGSELTSSIPTHGDYVDDKIMHDNMNQQSEEVSKSEVGNSNGPEATVELREDNISQNEISSFQAFDTVKFEPATQHTELSSVESLQQLSSQMAELMNSDSDFVPSSIENELEVRNQELAALLSQEKIKTEYLNATLLEYQSKLAQLEAELKDRQLNTDNRVEQETSSLREELQCHVQTVGILVAEKAELIANLGQFQMTTKQKTSECEELQGRLKTSRSRVADLEREIAVLKNEKSQNDNLGKEQNAELTKIRELQHSLKEEKDELLQDLLEVREKLKSSTENNLSFQQQVAELSNQLSMANIKIQQLTIAEADQASGQIEQLTQEKFTLEKQVSDLMHTVKTLSKEQEESSLQYQQYAQQLNAQLTNLATRLEQLQKENESLKIQEQNRIKHIGELEKQLQNIQNDQITFALQRGSSESKVELETTLKLVEQLKTKNVELQEDNVKIMNEKEIVINELEAKEESLREQEALIGELKGNQPDNAKLLATLESDKVAAARAVSQNTEMKKQMESMQEVFEKLNNDKIELTEKLTIEQHNSKELFEKLQKTELHLQTLADAIEIKDKELCHLRESSLELNKQVLNSEQLTDRLRHYEAQDHSTSSLQTELQEAKHTITHLTDEINQMKEKPNDSEAAELQRKLDHLELKNKELEEKLRTNTSQEETTTDSNHNDQWTTLDKESAMQHLEAKFLKTMEDIANLTEEKQRLEHLVLQLQGETETIGEYVALYQHQRSILKQKAIEKDQQLTQLANDREQIKSKLQRLNDLVSRLVVEKGAVPPELLQLNHSEGNDLCAEHAKINSEINKIAQSSYKVDAQNDDNKHSSETAEQIIALLSEIKSSNLVQPSENFHHCPWCSGQLITV